MTIDPFLVWNIVLSFIVVPFGWAFGKMFSEVKRLQILLNRTREDYATKSELRTETKEIKELIHDVLPMGKDEMHIPIKEEASIAKKLASWFSLIQENC